MLLDFYFIVEKMHLISIHVARGCKDEFLIMIINYKYM